MTLNLRNRFLVPTCAALVVAFGAYMAVTTHKAGEALEAAVFEEMEQAERLVGLQVTSWLEHRDQDVASWAELPLVRQAAAGESDAAATSALLKVLGSHAKDYEDLHLVGSDGMTVASSNDASVGVLNVRDRAYFQESLRTGKPSWSQALASKVTGNAILVVCHPVPDAAGAPSGAMMVGVVDLGQFTAKIIDMIHIGETGYAYICGADGTFLAHPKKELILATKITEWEFGRQILMQKEGHLEYDFGGVRKQAAFSTEPRLGWLVAVTVDNDEIYAAANQMRTFGIGLTAVALLLVAGVVFLVARSVTGPINAMIADLNAGSQQTAAASAQIADAAQTLAMQSSDQAAAVQETSASLEEMTANVNNTTKAAAHCQGLMQDASAVVATGLESMHAMVEAIGRIRGSADQTAKIVKTIDEIAFQTNLLALNAAVEAARAGDAGKGFAVVAEEVRNLALRSAESARETSRLIEESVNHAVEGVRVTEQTREAFESTATNAQKVAVQVDQIAAASKEQSVGIGQINQAVEQLDRNTQGAAATAEESASAAEELNAQSEQLHAVVDRLHGLVTGTSLQRAVRHGSSGLSDRGLHDLADSGAPRRQPV
ncbi:MAG: methyl-accepting chemotaxis protein [Candidatus Krumholzibacteriia bacterium]